MRNYSLIKEWFDLPEGYSDSIVEQMFTELQVKTYGRFLPFFESQIMNCCELENVWKAILTQKMVIMNKVSQELFISPDKLKDHYTTKNGHSNAESGSIDGTSFSVSNDKNYDEFDYAGYSENLLSIQSYIDKQINNMIRRYNLNSMLVGYTNYMCGGCPKEDPQCDNCGCGCEDLDCQ